MHPCPCCGTTAVQQLKYTLWGGTLGPRILGLVRCRACALTFRGRNGRKAGTAIAIYCVASVLLTALIAFALTLWIWTPVRQPGSIGSSPGRTQSREAARAVADSLLVLLQTSFANAASADGAAADFRDAELHYRFSPPQGWHRVPQGVIDEKNVGASAARIVAAFQPGAPDQLQPPMLVISHIDETGRTPAEINDELSHDSSLRLGQEGRLLVYDDKRGLIMTTEPARTQEGRRLRRLTVFKPAKLGLVHFDFYLSDAESPVYTEPLVTKVLDSLTFEPGFEMQNIAPDKSGAALAEIKQKLRANPFLLAMITLGFIGIIGGIVTKRPPKRQR